jgi:hypothetical protein
VEASGEREKTGNAANSPEINLSGRLGPDNQTLKTSHNARQPAKSGRKVERWRLHVFTSAFVPNLVAYCCPGWISSFPLELDSRGAPSSVLVPEDRNPREKQTPPSPCGGTFGRPPPLRRTALQLIQIRPRPRDWAPRDGRNQWLSVAPRASGWSCPRQHRRNPAYVCSRSHRFRIGANAAPAPDSDSKMKKGGEFPRFQAL